MKNFCITVVSAILISVSTELLLPETQIKKYARLILGLLVIIVIMNPLVELKNFDIQKQEYIFANKNIECDKSSFAALQQEQVRKIFAQNITNSITQDLIKFASLENNQFKVEVIIKINNNADEKIMNWEDTQIEKVNIYCDFEISNSLQKKIKSILKKKYELIGEQISVCNTH